MSFISPGTPLGILSGGTGQVTASAAYDALSPTTTQGDIEFRGSASNKRLAVGAAGRYLASAGAGADLVWSGIVLPLHAAHSTWNPAISTNYFWGDGAVLGKGPTSGGLGIIPIPITGNIIAVYLNEIVAGSAGSAGLVTLKIDVDAAGTGAAGTVGTYSLTSTASGVVQFTGLSIGVTAGHFFNLMDVTPGVWASTPTTVVGSALILLQGT